MSCPTMGTKPVLFTENSRTVLSLRALPFGEKMLCDGMTFSLGYSCVFSCEFCYVPSTVFWQTTSLLQAAVVSHEEAVIRKANTIKAVTDQLTRADGSLKYNGPEQEGRVIFTSPLVDCAGNMQLLRETAAVICLIMRMTRWHVRMLSKSSLLSELIRREMVPKKYWHRLIFGFSTGTLNDELAASIETGTPLVSKRLKELHWLQDQGLRCFAMLCPSLPEDSPEDYAKMSTELCAAVRIDLCEDVWAEALNVRGDNLTRSLAGLTGAGFHAEAVRLSGVCGHGLEATWEDYARATFEAHRLNIPAAKFHFLQYVEKETAEWWEARRSVGAVPLGKHVVEDRA